MKSIFLMLFIFIYTSNFAQKSNAVHSFENSLDVWDVQLAANIPNAKSAEFDGTYFYVASNFSSLISQYDITGNLVSSFSIPGVSSYNDLAFDGIYMYTGSGGTTIYQMDFSAHILVGTIASPVNVRIIAYDEANDGFWVGNWTDPAISLISRTGILISGFIPGTGIISGIAYDNSNPGGPFLWLFDRGTAPPGPQVISQYNLSSGTFTGVTHDVLSDIGAAQPNALGGGLFFTTGFIPFTFSVGGVLTGDPSILFLYDVTNPVPVELTFFLAVKDDKGVKLNWQTASETNNKGFEIERNSGTGFGTIGFLPGAGTTTEINDYNFSDPQLSAGSYTYRLKQLDYNGSFSYSNLVEILIQPEFTFSLEQNYPNPFNPATVISYTIPEADNVKLYIYNVLGRLVRIFDEGFKPAGTYYIKFTAGGTISSEYASGIYFYTLKCGCYIATKKMLFAK